MCGYAGTTTRDLPMAYMGCAKDCPVKTLADCQGTCKVDATCTAFSFYSTGIRGNCLYWTKAGYGPNAAREAAVAACHVRKTEGWAVYKITEVPLVPAVVGVARIDYVAPVTAVTACPVCNPVIHGVTGVTEVAYRAFVQAQAAVPAHKVYKREFAKRICTGVALTAATTKEACGLSAFGTPACREGANAYYTFGTRWAFTRG